MRKLFSILAVSAIFCLFFSGKPAALRCGSVVRIDNVDPQFFGIWRVDIVNQSTNITWTYTNPTYPIVQHTQGGNLHVVFYFDDVYNGALYLDEPCQMINFHNEGYAAVWWTGTCATYNIELIPGTEQTNYQCP